MKLINTAEILAPNPQNIAKRSLETKILNYKKVKQEIKELEKLKKAMEEDLLECYFNENKVAYDKNGLVLLTYMSYTRDSFQQTLFKTDHEDLYNKYVKEITVSCFK